MIANPTSCSSARLLFRFADCPKGSGTRSMRRALGARLKFRRQRNLSGKWVKIVSTTFLGVTTQNSSLSDARRDGNRGGGACAFSVRSEPSTVQAPHSLPQLLIARVRVDRRRER